MKTFLCSLLALALPAAIALAEEKNGMNVTVAKTTLEKNERNSTYYSYTNRTQALKVTVKNTSFKPMPEGEMAWKIVVVGSYSSTLSSGLEKINALKPAESQELVIGSAETSARKSSSGRSSDKIEYQITVKQGDKEIIKTQTTPGFDALAKRAYKPYSSGGDGGEGGDGKPKRDKNN